MAIKTTSQEKKERPGFILRVRAAGKLLEESILHPSKTSRIIIDPENDTVTVQRNGNGNGAH